MPSPAMTLLLRTIAATLDELRPSVPDEFAFSIVLVHRNDPGATIIVGQLNEEALLESLSQLVCDPGRQVGVANADEADLAPVSEAN